MISIISKVTVGAACVAVLLVVNMASAADFTLQKGLTVNGAVYDGVRDGYMEAGVEEPNPPIYRNHNNDDRMQVTGFASNPDPTERVRSLVKFDLSTLPAGLTIVSAKVYLYSFNATAEKGGAMGAYGLYRLNQSWMPGQVCWAYRQNTPVIASWDGGHYDTPADALAPKQATASVWYEWDVTARVREWYADGSTNFGWVVKAQDENMDIQSQFRTSDVTGPVNETRRPKLVIVTSDANLPGDFNHDGCVDVSDLLRFGPMNGKVEGDTGYDPAFDLNGDQQIGNPDLLVMAQYWGQ